MSAPIASNTLAKFLDLHAEYVQKLIDSDGPMTKGVYASAAFGEIRRLTDYLSWTVTTDSRSLFSAFNEVRSTHNAKYDKRNYFFVESYANFHEIEPHEIIDCVKRSGTGEFDYREFRIEIFKKSDSVARFFGYFVKNRKINSAIQLTGILFSLLLFAGLGMMVYFIYQAFVSSWWYLLAFIVALMVGGKIHELYGELLDVGKKINPLICEPCEFP